MSLALTAAALAGCNDTVAQKAEPPRPVAVKSYDSNDVVITGGVDEGAKIVALGVQKLDPGQTVRVLSAPSF